MLIFLVILALGLTGTILSTFYEKIEYRGNNFPLGLHKASYGFPLTWHGYSYYVLAQPQPGPPAIPDWFSSESLLLDAVFWFAISFFVGIAAIQLDKILRKTRTPRVQSGITI